MIPNQLNSYSQCEKNVRTFILLYDDNRTILNANTWVQGKQWLYKRSNLNCSTIQNEEYNIWNDGFLRNHMLTQDLRCVRLLMLRGLNCWTWYLVWVSRLIIAYANSNK